ncbi:hypothetical protein CcCBS67573_g08796 [Chytriomyces confervae]|uniref:Reelin domain-containing protein n=1 Tax=Chytriomyces confervae TaxID=246404 RepID=A0A507EHM9_9FUNG|nr:hypothetical protein CcCBS67573_g08796 [Chytriomyces confervae]
MHLIHSISLLTLAVATLAFPNGAPRCKITESIIAAGHKLQQGSLGLVMTLPATYTPGGPAIPITVAAANGSAVSFAGVLAYITPGNIMDSSFTAVPIGTPNVPNAGGIKQHVGKFNNLGAQNLRAQTAAVCTAQNVTNDNAASTITHSQPLTAKTPFTIMWTPPKTNAGQVTVNMVISSGSSRTPWQIVPSGQIQSTAGAAAAAAGAANGAATASTSATAAAATPAAKKTAGKKTAKKNPAKAAGGAAAKVANAAKAAAAKAANAAKAAAAKAANAAKAAAAKVAQKAKKGKN